MSTTTIVSPIHQATMSTTQLAAVSFLARYSGRTHTLYAFQLRQWFAWCEANSLEPLTGIQRAHVKLSIRSLGERGLMDSSINTMMHAVRGYFRFAHIVSGPINCPSGCVCPITMIYGSGTGPTVWTGAELMVPAGRPKHHRASRRPGVTCWASSERLTRLGCCGPHRGTTPTDALACTTRLHSIGEGNNPPSCL